MKKKRFMLLILVVACLTSQAQAQTLRLCTAEEQNSDAPPLDAGTEQEGDAPIPYDENVAAHRSFVLPILNYTRRTAPAHFPFSLSLLIDETGKPVCSSFDESSADPADVNPKRKAIYASIGSWHYMPFLVEGKAQAVWVTETIPEQIFLSRHVPMPNGSLSVTSIRLVGWWGEVTLDGNGKGIYHDRWADSQQDTSRTFTVSQGEVASLIERFRSADAWSLESRYVVHYGDDYTAPETLSLTIGGQTKSVAYHNPTAAGMPHAMVLSINAFEQLIDLKHSIHQLRPLNPPAIPVPPVPIKS